MKDQILNIGYRIDTAISIVPASFGTKEHNLREALEFVL